MVLVIAYRDNRDSCKSVYGFLCLNVSATVSVLDCESVLDVI